jgi:hypothetical protein
VRSSSLNVLLVQIRVAVVMVTEPAVDDRGKGLPEKLWEPVWSFDDHLWDVDIAVTEQ